MITGCSVFSKIDLKDAFNQILVVPADRNLTAFKCKFGIYEYKVMPFGLKNAPSTFQQMIDQVLNPILGTCCIAYLDDILVFSKDQVSHAHHLTQVFELLSAHNLKPKDSKSEFFKSKVTFIGGMIFEKGHAICPDKLQAVLNWKSPSSRTELKSFLGSVNFLRRFIKNLSKIAYPLTQLTSDKLAFNWTDTEEKAFTELKQSFTKAPVLIHPDFSKPFVLETDASNFANGAVLL